jgi:hypothetical protein
MQLFPNSGIAPSWSWSATKPAPTVFQPTLSGGRRSIRVKLWISGVVGRRCPRYGRARQRSGLVLRSGSVSSDTYLMIPPMQPERDAAAALCGRRSERSRPPGIDPLGRARNDCYNIVMRDSSSSSQSPRPDTGAFVRTLRRVRNPSPSDHRTSSRLPQLRSTVSDSGPFQCRHRTPNYSTPRPAQRPSRRDRRHHHRQGLLVAVDVSAGARLGGSR